MKNGAVYEGEYQMGVMHGRGVLKHADGTLYHDGVWRNGMPVSDDDS